MANTPNCLVYRSREFKKTKLPGERLPDFRRAAPRALTYAVVQEASEAIKKIIVLSREGIEDTE